jgi:hypothetical protein
VCLLFPSIFQKLPSHLCTRITEVVWYRWMRKRGNICSHTSARSAAHWLSSRALFSGVRGKRNKSNVRRILLSRSDDTRHWAMILSPSFARRRGARKESAMPLMQAVRTSDSSVCFKHCIFRKTLQTRWLSVYCVLRFFCFSYPLPLRVCLRKQMLDLLPLQGHDARRAHSPEAIKLKARGMPGAALAREETCSC